MRPSVSVASTTTEPLEIHEVKAFLDIPDSDDSHDQEIADLVEASRIEYEKDTQQVLVSRAVTERWSFFPAIFTLSYPVTTLTSIKYYDANNAFQTLSASIYSLDAPRRRIYRAVDQEWPEPEVRWDAVELIYASGATTVDEQSKLAMKIKIKEMFGDAPQPVLDGLHRAYEHKVIKNMRPTYP